MTKVVQGTDETRDLRRLNYGPEVGATCLQEGTHMALGLTCVLQCTTLGWSCVSDKFVPTHFRHKVIDTAKKNIFDFEKHKIKIFECLSKFLNILEKF